MEMAKQGFRINGWHVLAGLVVFFGTVIAVNVVMMRLALTSFPGETQEKSYAQGLEYNSVLEANESQRAAGWQVELPGGTEMAFGSTALTIDIYRAEDIPVSGMVITGSLFRPTTDEGSQIFSFEDLGSGQYTAELEGLAPGAWDLTVEGTATDGQTITAVRRLWVK